MSKLDMTLTEKVFLESNKRNQNLVAENDTFFDQKSINTPKEMDINVQEWLEVFAEDEVKLQGCR